jgi:hypothetical protein
VGPVDVEFLYKLCGLLKFFAGCYEKKFAITNFVKTLYIRLNLYRLSTPAASLCM